MHDLRNFTGLQCMSCSSCTVDLRGQTFVKCAECTTPSIELCTVCYFGKFETEKHKFNHDYYVITAEHLDFRCDDERPLANVLALIEASKRFNVGSWEELRSRSKLLSWHECEKVIMENYDLYSSLVDDFPQQSFQIDSSCLGSATRLMRVESVTPHPCLEPDMLGFMPGRADFDFEYDDGAELAIADLELTDSDTPTDIEIKLKVLRNYTRRLAIREDRKRFVISRDLTSIGNTINRLRQWTTEEAEVRGKFRPIERMFHTSSEFDRFVELMLTKKRLQTRIDHLKNPSAVEDAVSETSVRKGKKNRTPEETAAKIKEIITGNEQRFQKLGETEKNKSPISEVNYSVIKEILLRRLEENGAKKGSISIARYGKTFKIHLKDNTPEAGIE